MSYMTEQLRFYNLDKATFSDGELALESELKGGALHVKSMTLESGYIVIVGSNNNFTDERAKETIMKTIMGGKK